MFTLKNFAKTIFKFFGYNIVRSSKDNIDPKIWFYFSEKTIKGSLYYEGLKASNGQKTDNIPKRLRHYSLMQLVDYVKHNKIEGDFVECGVWKGHSAFLIAKLLGDNFNGHFHIFDSFEGGLSDKKKSDKIIGQTDEEIENERLEFSSNITEVKDTLRSFSFIKYYPGWIPDKFKNIKDENFSFVHIDVDLYEPTKNSLEFFFKRLNTGGVIVCDDYGSTQFPGAKKAVDEFIKTVRYSLFYVIPYGGCFIVK